MGEYIKTLKEYWPVLVVQGAAFIVLILVVIYK